MKGYKDTVYYTGSNYHFEEDLFLSIFGEFDGLKRDLYDSFIPFAFVNHGYYDDSKDDKFFQGPSKYRCGESATVSIGKAVAPSTNRLFSPNQQFFWGVNTNHPDIIELNRHNYIPYQPYSYGYYEGLISKVDIKAVDIYTLWKPNMISVPNEIIPLIYPNPAGEFINYSYELREDSQVDIEITDLIGNSYLKISEKRIKGLLNFMFNIEKYSSGVYLIKSKINNKQFNNKFIKK